jgi:hypothetical protein
MAKENETTWCVGHLISFFLVIRRVAWDQLYNVDLETLDLANHFMHLIKK